MRQMWDEEGYLVCPHTATAVASIKRLNLSCKNSVCLATAHPAKFEDAVQRALKGASIPRRPRELEMLFSLPIRTYGLPNALSSVQEFVRARVKTESALWDKIMFPVFLGAVAFTIGYIVVNSNKRKFH